MKALGWSCMGHIAKLSADRPLWRSYDIVSARIKHRRRSQDFCLGGGRPADTTRSQCCHQGGGGVVAYIFRVLQKRTRFGGGGGGSRNFRGLRKRKQFGGGGGGSGRIVPVAPERVTKHSDRGFGKYDKKKDFLRMKSISWRKQNIYQQIRGGHGPLGYATGRKRIS